MPVNHLGGVNDYPLEEAAQYQLPFLHVEKYVKPTRADNRIPRLRDFWWIHRVPGSDMRQALSKLQRYIVTPAVAKHRLFVWLEGDTLPDHQLYAFAREDDYFMGMLHSRVHELWALRQGTSLGVGNDPRYTPTTTFETFPFPWPPGQEPAEDEDERVAAIVHWARQLTALRQGWLHPPGVGITISEKQLNKRTLTNLYNALTHYRQNVKGRQRNPHQWKQDVDGIIDLAEIEQLDHIHHELDKAVLAAYGWPPHLSDDQILERLLALNLERAAQQ